MHKISFIVTSRNESQSMVDATIDGLLETTADYEREILLIDDGSEIPLVCARPDVVLLRNSQSIGVVQSRRNGASIATGNVLAWLDAHMTFAPDWLDKMIVHVDSGALLCSAAWNYNQTQCLFWGADIGWRERKNWEAPGFKWRHRTRFPGEGAVEVPAILGACYMIARDSYQKLGGLPPPPVRQGEEINLSVRSWMAGLGVKCVTGAKVGHLYRSQFPYRTYREYVEFAHLALIRTVFEEATVKAFETQFEPISLVVQNMLDGMDLEGWRAVVQSRRKITDDEFFRRHAPELLRVVSDGDELQHAEPRGVTSDYRSSGLRFYHTPSWPHGQ